MTGIELLKQIVTYKDNAYSKEVKETSLYNMIAIVPERHKNRLDRIADMVYHSEEQKKAKAYEPLYYVIGTFKDRKTKDDYVDTCTNLMTIDIDQQDNTDIDIEDLRKKIFLLPYVLGVYKSISRKGIYAIIHVEDGRCVKEYYKYFENLFKYKFNVNIDKQANNIARARFISYESDWYKWTKKNEVTQWKLKALPEQVKEIKENNIFDDDNYIMKLTSKAIWLILNSGYNTLNMKESRSAWYHLGCEFANFPDGESMFYKLSTNAYNDSNSVIAKKWKECLKNPTGINEYLHRKWQGMAKNKYGIHWYRE